MAKDDRKVAEKALRAALKKKGITPSMVTRKDVDWLIDEMVSRPASMKKARAILRKAK